MNEIRSAKLAAAVCVLAAFAGAVLAAFPALPGDPSPARSESTCHIPCREHPKLSGACYTVHGRMSFWNGAPSVRIRVVGTKRILGVSGQRFHEPGVCNLPPRLADRLSWDTDLFADFTVCPFTPDQPGVMQMVCVDGASNVVVRPGTR